MNPKILHQQMSLPCSQNHDSTEHNNNGDFSMIVRLKLEFR